MHAPHEIESACCMRCTCEIGRSVVENGCERTHRDSVRNMMASTAHARVLDLAVDDTLSGHGTAVTSSVRTKATQR